MELRDELQKIALKSPSHSYRWITVEFAAPELRREPQADLAHAAPRQSPVRAAACVCDDHRLKNPSGSKNCSEPKG
jgi:hypothetical protein